MKITLANNLPSASSPWGRQVSEAVNSLDTTVDRFVNNQTNLNRANNSNIQLLISQNAQLKAQNDTLTQQQATLQSQQAELKRQSDYQAGLVTVSAEGVTYDSPAIPADSTFRYYESSPTLEIKLKVPTGRLLLQYGSGECLVNRAGAPAVVSASITYMLRAPSGWSYTPTVSRGRMTVYDTGREASPLAASSVIDGVPTDETITVTIRYGIWGGGDTGTVPAGAAHHTSNYLVAQVIPA